MHATLDPKNEVVLNTFKAAFDSRTYVQFYELVNRAAHGDLQAREAAGEMLAGILIAKKFGNVSKAGKGTKGAIQAGKKGIGVPVTKSKIHLVQYIKMMLMEMKLFIELCHLNNLSNLSEQV